MSEKITAVQRRLLEEVADLHGVPEGAYNIRANGHLASRQTTANISIESKTDVSGIDIRIKADKQFTRDGDDLHCWIQVPMSWAVLGHDLSIDTFDGEKTVSIPAGCQTEDTVTLKGLGVTNIRNKDERGNLIAHVNVLIPTKLNETERGLIEQFAASHDSGATHVSQASRPQAGQKKGFFSKLKDALS